MYLNGHSYFSLRYGTLSPAELVKAAKACGIKALALTDINNTSCGFEFIQQCKVHGIKPLLGIEFRKEGRFLYVGIAKNEEGFRELNALLTNSSLKGEPLPEVAPAFEQAFVIYDRLIKPIKLFRPNEWIGVRPAAVHRLFSGPLKKYLHRAVMFCPVTFLDKDGFKLHKLLRAIDLNILITQLEEKDHAQFNEVMRSPREVLMQFENYPIVIDNTKRLINACSIEMQSTFKNNRQTFTGNRIDDLTLLRKLAIKGCENRYGERNGEAMDRVKSELKVIDQMDFAPYFLITWDIIRYAQSVGYHHIGRGSGANSIVAFCLYITDVDPLELDLYFERFINPYRSSPPDFDIDFSWDERDDVTDYIFKRYGHQHTALLATYNTFKGKSTIRELGKSIWFAQSGHRPNH